MTLQDLSLKTAQVGKLYCQRNSMAKILRTKVLSCVIDEKASTGDAKQFEVLLEDTIIFPTGGGQPSDRGFIKTLDGVEVNVLCCDRKGLSAIHYVDAPLIPDTEVEVHVDWKNRFDHMQQHSGQHIVSDIAEHLYEWTTFCWNMGKEKSFIEFQNVSPSQSELDKLEDAVNDFILENHPMELEETQIETHLDKPDSLPSDIQSGVVRNIKFGTFAGPCCGTHVTSTGQIQMIKLLNAEKVRGGNSRVWFLAGRRLLDSMAKSMMIEKSLNNLLSASPSDFADRVSKKLAQVKELTKENKRLLKELKDCSKS